MQFYFKYLSAGEAWAPIETVGVEAWDEQTVSLSMTHSESAFAAARVQVQARETSYHALGRYAVLSVRVSESDAIVPFFRGVVTAVPRGLRDDIVELELIARPNDWQARETALIATLANAPYYDPMLAESDELKSEEVLYGHAALLVWNRLTGDPRVSYIDSGPRTLELSNIAYDSMSIEPDAAPPLSSASVELTASWQQDAAVTSRVTWNFASSLEVMAHAATQQAWPKPGVEIGGDWVVEESALTFAKPRHVQLGKVSGKYNSDIYSGTVPIYAATSARVILRNNRKQARTEKLTLTVTAPVQNLMSTTTGHEEVSLRQVIGSGDEYDPWQPTVSYSVGDVVFYEKRLYSCVGAHTSTYTFNAEKWGVLSSSAGKIAESFFETARGLQVIHAATKRAIARLRFAARAVRIKFEVPLADCLDFRIDDMIRVSDDRLPGGTALGKLISFVMSATEDGGRWCEVEISCSVGLGGSRVPASVSIVGPAAPKLGPTNYPATGTVSPLAPVQLADLRKTPDLQTLEVRVQIDAPAVPATYELKRTLTVSAGILDLPEGISL